MIAHSIPMRVNRAPATEDKVPADHVAGIHSEHAVGIASASPSEPDDEPRSAWAPLFIIGTSLALWTIIIKAIQWVLP